MRLSRMGRHWTEDLSSPANERDLAANEPPAPAYEDLPAITGRVGNINLANIQ